MFPAVEVANGQRTFMAGREVSAPVDVDSGACQKIGHPAPGAGRHALERVGEERRATGGQVGVKQAEVVSPCLERTIAESRSVSSETERDDREIVAGQCPAVAREPGAVGIEREQPGAGRRRRARECHARPVWRNGRGLGARWRRGQALGRSPTQAHWFHWHTPQGRHAVTQGFDDQRRSSRVPTDVLG